MKKLFTILTVVILATTISSAQQIEKGTLLLEGGLDGTAWNSLSTTDLMFGMYLSDGFALTMGSEIGIVENDELNLKLGARVHFSESQLIKIDLKYDGVTEDITAYIGVANRFYFKDWMSIEPQAGFTYEGEALTFSTGVGFNFHFQKD